MSTQTPVESRVYGCEGPGCEHERTPQSSVHGSYCSRECYHRDCGADFLRNFKFDHRWCAACLRQLKEVERPTDDDLRGIDPISSEAIVGYQYLTHHADVGEKTLRGIDEDADRAPSETLVTTGACCGECGTTDHRDTFLRADQHPSDVARRLLEAVERTGREGQHDKTLDAKAFVETLRESVREDGVPPDYALAVGRALTER